MMNGKRIVGVLPACNAARALEAAQRPGLIVVAHPKNRGYGANRKTCCATALARRADVVLMIHPSRRYSMPPGTSLSEYHTGFRADGREFRGARTGEISCPAGSFRDASSIYFRRSLTYGLGVWKTGAQARMALWGPGRASQFEYSGFERKPRVAAPEKSR